MSTRAAPLIAASLVLLMAGACAGASTTASPRPVPTVAPTERPAPTPVPGTPEPEITPSPLPNAGGVEGGYPELTIELVGDDVVEATLVDPSAKAWRLVVAGVGERSGDRFEIVVETSDVEPDVLVSEIQSGRLVDEMDLSRLGDTAAAGGCHRTLPVCVASDGFAWPENGDGTLVVRLALPEPGTALTITGGTAGWPGEPFILGPWTDTESFPWGG